MKLIKRAVQLVLVLATLGVIGFFIFAPPIVEKGQNRVTEHAPYEISEAASALHNDLIIGDWHADTMLWKRDLLKRSDRGHVDLPRLQDGNAAIQVFTAVTKSPAGQNYEANSADARDNITLLSVGQLWPAKSWNSLLERALYQAEKLHEFADNSEGALWVVTDQAGLESVLNARANGSNTLAGLLGIEGAHALEGDVANLDRLEGAGYRVIGLQHFFDNELGGSLHGFGNQGLTEFGRTVVREIESRNMVLDLAHSSPAVAREVIAMTDMPVIVSHTGIFSHCQVKRNFEDALMEQVARSGGVVGIGFWADVTCDDSPAGVARTIKAAIDLLGEDHVSLGSDWDGSVQVAMDASETPALTQALLDLGLSETQIRKVMGENLVRVLRARLAP